MPSSKKEIRVHPGAHRNMYANLMNSELLNSDQGLGNTEKHGVSSLVLKPVTLC